MEEIIFDDYDECEVENASEMKAVKNHRYSRGIRKCALALALAVAVSTGFTAVPGKFNNMATVEAARKKDKKKPVIKLSGRSNIRVTQNESVKIPRATAKDNVDGNITRKIKVSVKLGKKSYASIAKKIRKNKAVKFTKTGKYTITYTVSDKAKNKATKKRTVTVVAKQEGKKTTEDKTTAEQTTENKTTTEQVTTAVTTEAPTTEDNTNNTVTDFSKYDIKTITVNNNTYKTTRDEKFGEEVTTFAGTTSDKITLKIENDYDVLNMDINDQTIMSSEYLKYFGKISAYDENGNDISERVIISEGVIDTLNKFRAGIITIYVEDSNGNKVKKQFEMSLFEFDESYDEDTFGRDYKMISKDPKVYARRRSNASN